MTLETAERERAPAGLSAAQIEARIRDAYRRFYARPRRLARELRHPARLAGRVLRYFTLFRRRA